MKGKHLLILDQGTRSAEGFAAKILKAMANAKKNVPKATITPPQNMKDADYTAVSDLVAWFKNLLKH
jgi:cytochrome c551/c552